jgi:hypothetical protein
LSYKPTGCRGALVRVTIDLRGHRVSSQMAVPGLEMFFVVLRVR